MTRRTCWSAAGAVALLASLLLPTVSHAAAPGGLLEADLSWSGRGPYDCSDWK